VHILIDGARCCVRDGDTIFETARRAGIEIPTLCYADGLGGQGTCGMCVVEVRSGGVAEVVTSCTYQVTSGGMEVHTLTPGLKALRREQVVRLAHEAPASRVVRDLRRRYGVADVESEHADRKCILCRLCVAACEAVGASAITVVGDGDHEHVDTPAGVASPDCTGCLACARVCPTGAISVTERQTKRTIWHKDFEPPAYTPRHSGRITADPARCTGCKTCVMACSLHHEGTVTPHLARLRVGRDYFAGPVPLIELCGQCLGAECLLACPTAAIREDAETGARVVDETKCVACGICVEACRFRMIALAPDGGRKAVKCDLCDGEPACVRYCPQGALSYEPWSAS